MRRNDALRALSLVAPAALLAECGAPRAQRSHGMGFVAGVGGFGDRGVNDDAKHGLDLARRELGFRTIALASTSVADYQPNITVLANEPYDIIVTNGYDTAIDLAEVAERFPTRQFGIIDASVDAPNVMSIAYHTEQSSFLAGALAAMVSKTRILGFLGGADVALIRGFEVGFRAGARAIDPAVRVGVKYVGDFLDVPGGDELSGLLFNGGADIVFTAAGKTGLGAINQVRRRPNAYVIGVDTDQDDLLPGKILTSAMKRIGISLLRLCERIARSEPLPHTLVFGLQDGGVGLTDFRYTREIVTAAVRTRLDHLTAGIVSGHIVVPSTEAQLAAWRP
jgi:basic membrane protein A